jgi:YegS/Rv2252/BmrU family lipid kinase
MPPPPRFQNAALIYNPVAGRLRWDQRRERERAVALLRAYGIGVNSFPTTGPGNATELARQQVAAGRDLIIVSGGDGTINEVVNGMAGSSVPLAVLPAGSANVLAKELNLPWSPWRAAEYIPRGVVRRIALGRAGQRHFIAVAGAGADANIVYQVAKRSKMRLGTLSYWLESFRQLFLYDFPEFTVRIGEETLASTLLVVSRTRHYGGPVQITRRADLFGDQFEICLFPRRLPIVYLVYFLAQLVGQLESFPEVRFRRGQELRAERGMPRIHVQVDGELAGQLPTDFVIVPNALSLLVPPSSS